LLMAGLNCLTLLLCDIAPRF